MFFVSFFLSDSSFRGHACECADFDSGFVELTKGISLKLSSNVSVLGWVAVMAPGVSQYGVCGPMEGN